jgi:hypothetical protein
MSELLRAVAECAKRVFSSFSGFFGTALSIMSVILERVEKTLLLPTWGWFVIGALLLFARACKVEWELLKENEKNESPEPEIDLLDVVQRALGTTDILGGTKRHPSGERYCEKREAIRRVFHLVRERAVNNRLTVFGRIGWESASPDQYRVLPRKQINAAFWESHEIDYPSFVNDKIGRTSSIHARRHGVYLDLWFDENEIERIWPARRRKLVWQSPLRLANKYSGHDDVSRSGPEYRPSQTHT